MFLLLEFWLFFQEYTYISFVFVEGYWNKRVRIKQRPFHSRMIIKLSNYVQTFWIVKLFVNYKPFTNSFFASCSLSLS